MATGPYCGLEEAVSPVALAAAPPAAVGVVPPAVVGAEVQYYPGPGSASFPEGSRTTPASWLASSIYKITCSSESLSSWICRRSFQPVRSICNVQTRFSRERFLAEEQKFQSQTMRRVPPENNRDRHARPHMPPPPSETPGPHETGSPAACTPAATYAQSATPAPAP